MKVGLIAIARMENSYIKEFCDYYLNLGFDNIIIYDNNRTGEESFDTVLSDYINNNKVLIMNVRDQKNCQMAAYNHAIDTFTDYFDFMAFFDVDEYLTLNNNFDNIKDYLSLPCFSDKDIIHINWRIYGDCGIIRKTEGLLRDRFPFPLPITQTDSYKFSENFHIKSILHTSINKDKTLKFDTQPHTPVILKDTTKVCNNKGNLVFERAYPWNDINYDYAYIKHYKTKSLEEFYRKKMKIGRIDNEDFKITMDNYWSINEKTQEKIDFLSLLEKENQ